MNTILLDECPNSNTETEPEMLVIHLARDQQRADWGDWARDAAEFLKAHGWRLKRIGPDMHAIHPIMATVQ